MNELETRYTDAMFASRYPQFVLEQEAAQEKASKAKAEAAPKDDGPGEMKEIERTNLQKAVGNMGALIQSWAEQLDKVGFKFQLPGGGEANPTLKDVTLGDMGKVIEDMSYGFYPVKGSGMTTGLKPEATELLNLPVLAAPLAAVKTMAKGGKAMKAITGAAAGTVAADAPANAPQPKKKDKVMRFDSEGRPFPTGGDVRAPVRG